MLGDTTVTTLVAVKDLGEAKDFYGEKLQLVRTDERPEWAQYRSGASDLIVYESRHAGTNKGTTAAWTVSDVEETVRVLKANGVNSFQHYDDLPGYDPRRRHPPQRTSHDGMVQGSLGQHVRGQRPRIARS
jgi:hypothetical protein